MIIDCISDLHGYYPELEGGDLLIIAGDCTRDDRVQSWNKFFNWLDKQKYRKKVMIAGNHDNFCTQWAVCNDSIHDVLEGRPSVSYLCDSGEEFEGIKIWGTPWTATFEGINPDCMAFTIPFGCDTEEWMEEKWSLIPEDTEILITHCPPYGILDGIPLEDGTDFHVGSKSLRDTVLSSKRLSNLKLHVFGHIHEKGGKKSKTTLSTFVNASHVNERYKPSNKAVRVIL